MATQIISIPQCSAPKRGVSARRVWQVLVERHRMRQTLRQLAELDAHHLADIGASRADAVMADSRPLWGLHAG